MNEYMLIYKGGDPDWMQNSTPEEIQEKMAKWSEWMAQLEQSEQLSTGGSPLHYSGKSISREGIVTDITAAEFKELVSGYSIVKANSIDEAVAIAKVCPIFSNPDITVEVREVVQLG